MEYYQFPGTDFKLSKLIFGAWGIVGGFNWGPQDEKDSVEALKAAFDAGINFFDTAEAYGNGKSEEMIADTLGHVRKEIFIGTKILPKDFAYDNVKKACEERLKTLRSDYIDLLQLHWPSREIPLEETLRALEDLKKEGKIHHLGLSNYGVKDMGEALEVTKDIFSNQLPYNLLWRAIEYEILPKCIDNNIPVLTYSSIMQGLLAGKFNHPDEVPEDRARSRHFSKDRPQARHNDMGEETLTFETIKEVRKIADELGVPMGDMSIAWLMAQKGVGGVIVGGRNAEQVHKNVKATELTLTDDVIHRLNKATDPLKEKLGKNADLWESDSRIH